MSKQMKQEGNDLPIALRRKVDFVGKRSKRSKVCVFWAFQSRRGSKFRHEVKMTYSSMSGKRRIWFNGKVIHESQNRFQSTTIPHRHKWTGGGYRLECLSLKTKENYKINLIVDDIPFINLPRRTTQISIKDVLKPRRMCRVDGTWGQSTAVSLGCSSEHLGKRLSGSKRKIKYMFVFLDDPKEVHVVEVMYSILSGKREIKVDKKLVHKSQKLQMSLKFQHAFQALGGHMFEMLVEEKTDVILTRLCIDGMDFRRLPLLSRAQLDVAIADMDSPGKVRATRSETFQEGIPDDDEYDDDDDDDDDDDSDNEDEQDAATTPQTNGGDDLLADLFGPATGTTSAGTNSTSTFDPFADQTSSSNRNGTKKAAPAIPRPGTNTVDNLGDLFAQTSVDTQGDDLFADSPTPQKVAKVMDPFAQLVAKSKLKDSKKNDPLESFDPFADM